MTSGTSKTSNIKHHSVAIVVDSHFDDRVVQLAAQHHVCLADTPENRAAAKRGRDQTRHHDLDAGITTFPVDRSKSAEEWIISILPVVTEHHGLYSHDPPLSAIDLIGCQPTPALVEALAVAGFTSIVADATVASIHARRLQLI